MASTHSGYLKMKMSGPNGTITVAGDYRVSMQCASAGSAIAESMVIAEEKKKQQFVVSLAQTAALGMQPMGSFQAAPTFKPTEETKQVHIDPAHPELTINIGTGLSDKQESELIQFLRENLEIFAWSHKDLLGVPKELCQHSSMSGL